MLQKRQNTHQTHKKRSRFMTLSFYCITLAIFCQAISAFFGVFSGNAGAISINDSATSKIFPPITI